MCAFFFVGQGGGWGGCYSGLDIRAWVSIGPMG